MDVRRQNSRHTVAWRILAVLHLPACPMHFAGDEVKETGTVMVILILSGMNMRSIVQGTGGDDDADCYLALSLRGSTPFGLLSSTAPEITLTSFQM